MWTERGYVTDLLVGRTLTFGMVCVTALRSSTLSVRSRDLLECRVSNDRETIILGPSKLQTDLSSRDPPGIIEPCPSHYKSNCILLRLSSSPVDAIESSWQAPFL